MATTTSSPEIQVLLEQLDHGFERRSWHGPNLRGSIRGLSAAQAAWRPGQGRHSIAEQVVHCAYWKNAVRRMLLGEPRSWPLKGSNWIPVSDALAEREWRQYVALLASEHRVLRDAVENLPVEQLRSRLPGRKFATIFYVEGVAFHDIYHAGQISLIKRLWRARRGA